MDYGAIPNAQISAFKRHLQSEERVPATIRKYLRDIRSFVAWLGARPLGKDAAAGWKEYLRASQLCPETVNSKLSALNKFFRFLRRQECCVKYLRIQRRLFRRREREMSRADYTRLLETAGERCGSEGVCAVTEGLKKWAAQAVEALRTQAGHTLRPLDEVFVRENFPLQAEEPVWEENSQAWELVNTYVLSAIRAGLD